VDEALEALLATPAAEIHRRVVARLDALAHAGTPVPGAQAPLDGPTGRLGSALVASAGGGVDG